MMGRVYRLEVPEAVLGRGDRSTIQVEDEGISRNHAKIVAKDNAYFLADLGSTNGTICNGQPVTTPVMLRDGDRIRLGPTAVLRFEFQDELEEQMRSRLYDLATRDALTKAYNRRYFLERLGSEWAWAIRHKKPCALLTLDVDYFKRVNDTYGHPAGDYVLREITKLMQQAIRKEDLFARIGGEEFCFLARATEKPEAMLVGERLRFAVDNHDFMHNGTRMKVTISVGVATSNDKDITTPDYLMAKADEWLYKAKQGGRNRVETDPTSWPPADPPTG